MFPPLFCLRKGEGDFFCYIFAVPVGRYFRLLFE